ncbi:deoxycytidylate deaminase [Actinoplanes sp. CA-054009]
MAKAANARADCSRRKVGAVIVNGGEIVSTGYNGSPPGGPSCLAGECPRGRMTYEEQPADIGYDNCVAVHAEANACLRAGRNRAWGGELYLTDPPCVECRKTIQAVGIFRVVWPGGEWLPDEGRS